MLVISGGTLQGIIACSSTLQGISAGSSTHALAEEGRSKLLLGAIPEGTSAADEVSARLRLWESGNFEMLLQRGEQQIIVSRRLRARGPSAKLAESDRKSRKAKEVAAEGAHAKATRGLVSEMMNLTATDNLKYANELLPRSSDSSSALSSQVDVPSPDAPASGDTPTPSRSDRWQECSPLKGVKYASLVAPGPSGARPEHLRDMLSVPRRADANRLLKSLAAFHKAIDNGALPADARWITRTRLCWQRKKSGKPRPIKMGEFLRSCYVKQLVHQHRVKLRQTCLGMHQWGIGLPGAVEALAHWRGTIEELIFAGDLEPMIAADLDLINMFGNAEWPAIRSAAIISKKRLPGQAGITFKCPPPSYLLVPNSQPTGVPSKATSWDPYRAP